jgi:hypothetical protein
MQVTDTGVLLETLVTDAGPAYPASLLNTKNELLRVTVTVTGTGHRAVTFAVGELDSNFGNHPALLVLTQNGRPVPFSPSWSSPATRARCGSCPGSPGSRSGSPPRRPRTPLPRPAARWWSSTDATT